MRSNMDAFLRNTPGHDWAFAPVMEALAARVGGMEYRRMMNDPGHWCRNLTKAGQLLEADALILGFDNTLLAEACGAGVDWQNDRPLLSSVNGLSVSAEIINGRLKNALDALGRLCQIESRHFCCIAAMTGPVTLTAQLNAAAEQGNVLKQFTVQVAQALCNRRPDLLLLREGSAICTGDIGMPQRKAFNTLCNVARYFSIPTAVYVEGYTQKHLATIDKLKTDFYFFGATADGSVPDPQWFTELAERVKGIGIALSFAEITAVLNHAQLCRTVLAGRNILFTSTEALGQDTDLDRIRVITTGLKALCQGQPG